ncbi:MAG: hypothetical protein JSW34_02380 [Candidatus Zixiibacteriota bacterium]|nr:MAG: hypothetical protein JSW34_02380 [candidate division Zixibacteria bacterium]
MKITPAAIVLALTVVLLLSAAPAVGQDRAASGLDGKIAFLQNGEVCASHADGSDIIAVTQTGGKVDDFVFSPRLEYLAFTREFAMAPGLVPCDFDGEEWPMVPIHSVVFINLATMSTLTEIEPEELWQHLGQWTAPDRFVFYLTGTHTLAGYVEHDIKSNTQTKVDRSKEYDLYGPSYSADYNLVLYTTDSGLGETYHHRLHLLDRTTGEDRILVRQNSIFSHNLSPDNKSVALMGRVSRDNWVARDVWIYRVEDESLELFLSDSAGLPRNGPTWSPDGKFIGLADGVEMLLTAVENPLETHRIKGNHFSWIDDKHLLMSRGNGIYQYDLASEQARLIINNAAKPMFLKAAGGP